MNRWGRGDFDARRRCIIAYFPELSACCIGENSMKVRANSPR